MAQFVRKFTRTHLSQIKPAMSGFFTLVLPVPWGWICRQKFPEENEC
jgi:hypothetical protein